MHLGGMEQLLSLVLAVTAALAAAIFVTAGVFSLVSLWRGDLLESDEQAPAIR